MKNLNNHSVFAKPGINLIGVLVFALLLFGSRQSHATVYVIEARNVFYSPANVTVAPGDTVRFVWIEGFHPTASLTGAWATFPLDNANTSYDLVLNSTGIYPYECTVHNIFGMTGVITVDASAPSCNPAVAPSGLSTTVAAGSASLSWNAVAGADGYNVRGQPLGAPGLTNLITVNASRSVGGLSPATSYRWQVRARCASTDEITPFSPFDTFTTASAREVAFDAASDPDLIGELRYLGAAQSLRFSFELREALLVHERLIDLSGRIVFESSRRYEAGTQFIEWDASSLPDGVYLLELSHEAEGSVLRFYLGER